MLLDPTKTTVGDLCEQALRESGAFGLGQTPLANDVNDAQFRLQLLLQEWERKRWLVYHLVTYSIVSTGAISYTIGPGGQINTDLSPWDPAFSPAFGGAQNSVRPARLESAFLRQLVSGGATSGGAPLLIDYPLDVINAMEDYNRIALKNMVSFPTMIFYDSGWPLGRIFPWPVPNASIYGIFVTIMAQLPISFLNQASSFQPAPPAISLPFEYYSAMLYNLALRLRSKYSIPTFQGDQLPALAKQSLNVLRGANTQIARLQMPKELSRPGIYNIFSDRVY